jgi:hypothetical protein
LYVGASEISERHIKDNKSRVKVIKEKNIHKGNKTNALLLPAAVQQFTGTLL